MVITCIKPPQNAAIFIYCTLYTLDTLHYILCCIALYKKTYFNMSLYPHDEYCILAHRILLVFYLTVQIELDSLSYMASFRISKVEIDTI